MSLILEALKKSEQQRRLGQAPDLGTPVMVARRRRHLAGPAFVVVIIAVAAGTWWWMHRSEPPPAATAPAVTAPAAPPAPTPAERVEARRAERLARMKARTQQVRSAEETRRTRDMKTGVVQAPATAPREPKAKAPSGAAAPPPAAAASNVPAKTSATPAAAATPARPTSPGSAVPFVWELPYGTRKDLPELTLTMHYYSADPKQRFVILDGQRHIEGDALDNGVSVVSIRQDGVVLEFKGQQFLLPRAGR